MRAKPVVLKPGMWVRRKPGTIWEERAVLVALTDEVALIHREHQEAPEPINRNYLAFAWRIMRPSYRNYREDSRVRRGEPPFPEWVVPGGRYMRHFCDSVYEIVEVRGMWMLSREVVTGALLFVRASQLSKFRPIATRFQRVL